MIRLSSIKAIVCSVIALGFCISSCQKDKLPQASIYVFDQNQNPVSKIDVRFYVKDTATNQNALDTTIKTNDSGIAHFETAHDAYLNVSVIYYKGESDTYLISETVASLITNQHFVDTLIIYSPDVN